MDPTKKSSVSFFADEVFDNPFSSTHVGVQQDSEVQEIPSSSIESEPTVILNDEELRQFLEQQKNCNTQKKNFI